LLYTTFGDVPSVGEQVDVDGYRFIVEQLDGHRIAKVRIVAPKKTGEEA
jgi:CBS domain containing-hemolysin-like protein